MPTFCAVVGCGKRGDRDRSDHSFFRLPCIPKRALDSTLSNLKIKRRMKWILALRRADLTETKLKYAVVCSRHFISGRPADNYDIENPDWVPSINMGYETTKKSRPQKPGYISPHIEYLRKSIVIKDESSNTAHSNQSSLSSDMEENVADEDSNISEVMESGNIAYQNATSEEDNVKEEINALEENISHEVLTKDYVTYGGITIDKNSEDIISSEENTTEEHYLSEFVSDNSELHKNMSSKKVQTDVTMIDLDKISDAFKSSVAEVKQLKAKLKSLTEDILHLNDMYC